MNIRLDIPTHLQIVLPRASVVEGSNIANGILPMVNVVSYGFLHHVIKHLLSIHIYPEKGKCDRFVIVDIIKTQYSMSMDEFRSLYGKNDIS